MKKGIKILAFLFLVLLNPIFFAGCEENITEEDLLILDIPEVLQELQLGESIDLSADIVATYEEENVTEWVLIEIEGVSALEFTGIIFTPSIEGTYTVTFTLNYEGEEKVITRIVTVTNVINQNPEEDTIPPVLTVETYIPQEVVINYEAGGAIRDNYNITATDLVDGDLTDSVVITMPDTTQTEFDGIWFYPENLGNYNVVFMVSDAAGNETSVQKTLRVIENYPPELTVPDQGIFDWWEVEEYQSQNLMANFGLDMWDTAIDNVEATDTITNNSEATDITNDVTITVVGSLAGDVSNLVVNGAFTPVVADTYTITYRVEDSSGNNDEEVRTLVVNENIAPVIIYSRPVEPIYLGDAASYNTNDVITAGSITITDNGVDVSGSATITSVVKKYLNTSIADETITVTNGSFTPIKGGLHLVTISVTDSKGNTVNQEVLVNLDYNYLLDVYMQGSVISARNTGEAIVVYEACDYSDQLGTYLDDADVTYARIWDIVNVDTGVSVMSGYDPATDTITFAENQVGDYKIYYAASDAEDNIRIYFPSNNLQISLPI